MMSTLSSCNFTGRCSTADIRTTATRVASSEDSKLGLDARSRKRIRDRTDSHRGVCRALASFVTVV